MVFSAVHHHILLVGGSKEIESNHNHVTEILSIGTNETCMELADYPRKIGRPFGALVTDRDGMMEAALVCGGYPWYTREPRCERFDFAENTWQVIMTYESLDKQGTSSFLGVWIPASKV